MRSDETHPIAHDGLRAISIGLVLFSHLTVTQGWWPLGIYGRVGDLGNFGVRVFFVISGFLITSLLLKEIDKTGTISLRNFYVRRTLRIFPAFYIFIGAMAICWGFGLIYLQRGDLFCAVVYMTNYWSHEWWLGHIWSLSVEEQFLLWPRLPSRWATRTRGPWVAALVCLIAPLSRAAFYVFQPANEQAGNYFPNIADAIAIGCFLAFPTRVARASNLVHVRSPLFVLVPLSALYFNRHFHSELFRLLYVESYINLCICLTIDWCLRFPHGWVGRILNSRPFVFVGVLSYSLYLWQQPFLRRSLPYTSKIDSPARRRCIFSLITS